MLHVGQNPQIRIRGSFQLIDAHLFIHAHTACMRTTVEATEAEVQEEDIEENLGIGCTLGV